MYCIECGAKIEESSKFCPHCGRQLAQASKPGDQQPPSMSPPPAFAPTEVSHSRKKTSPRWLLVLILVLVAAVAGTYLWLGPYRSSQLSKEVILERSVQIMNNLKSYHFSIQRTTVRDNTERIMDVEGDFQAPDKAQWAFSFEDAPDTEFVGVGDTVYLREANEKWRVWESGGLDATFAGIIAKQPELFSKAYRNLVQLDDEKVDGNACYHIRFAVDVQKYLALQQIERGAGEEPLAIDVDVWISKQDYSWLQSKQETIQGSNGGQVIVTSIVKLSDFDKDLIVSVPTLTDDGDGTPTKVPFQCEDPLGCVTYSPDDPIRISTLLVISGPNTELGLDSQRGVEVAIELYGDVLGHKVELQAEDDMCSAEGGQTSAQKIVSDPSIVAAVGTSCSGAGVPASKIISNAGYVMISPSNTSPALTDPDQAWNPGYLRTVHNDKVQAVAMARFAREVLGVTKAAAIHDGAPYTRDLARAFADSFAEMGGEIVAFEAVGIGDRDMRPVLVAVSQAGPPEFLYYPVFIAEGSFITVQASEVAGLENTILAGADGMMSPDFVEAAGGATEGMYLSGPDLDFSSAFYDRFLETYERNYGTPPTAPFHAHSADATYMIFRAIEQVAVQDEDGTIHIGRQALRDALYTTRDYQGITGSLTCNQYGDCADPSITVSQIVNGEFVSIWEYVP